MHIFQVEVSHVMQSIHIIHVEVSSVMQSIHINGVELTPRAFGVNIDKLCNYESMKYS